MIGKARRLPCLGGLSGTELGLDYESGAKAWMISAIFFVWLQRFDVVIGQAPGRRDILFVDDASSHGTPTNLPELQHTKLEFIPYNTTPLLQRLDLGMVACIKKSYKSIIANKAVNLVDSGYLDSPYKIDIRMAGMWIYDIWTRLQHDIIYKFWTKSQVVQIFVQGTNFVSILILPFSYCHALYVQPSLSAAHRRVVGIPRSNIGKSWRCRGIDCIIHFSLVLKYP